MKRRTFALCAAAFLLFAGTAHCQVMSDQVRQKRLGNISRVVDAPAPDLDKLLAACKDPFVSHAPARQVVAPTGGGPVIDPTKPSTILNAAADIMHPTGVLSSGGKLYLSWADGSLYEVGKSFVIKLPAPIGDYEILIEYADNTHYVLRKGDITITRYFEDENPTGSGATESVR